MSNFRYFSPSTKSYFITRYFDPIGFDYRGYERPKKHFGEGGLSRPLPMSQIPYLESFDSTGSRGNTIHSFSENANSESIDFKTYLLGSPELSCDSHEQYADGEEEEALFQWKNQKLVLR